MNQTQQCPECQTPLLANSPQGMCPACLLKRGLDSNTIGFTEDDQPVSNHWTPLPPQVLAAHFPELDSLEFIGRGGMGAVYKARQKSLDRIIALKILPPEIGRDPDFTQRFAREAQAMARLSHPNIVAIFEFGERDGLFFFLMEFVDGLNLRQLLITGNVSPTEALAIVPQICDALQYAHDRGMVHRDIKPENILLDKHGQVKIADFGLAKLVGLSKINEDNAKSSTSSTLLSGDSVDDVTAVSGKVLGTPQYMAPEQLNRPSEVDHRADIYALGVVFYQMLTGELPAGKFQVPSKKVVIDVRLDQVVLRALESEPSLRYQQVSEVRTSIESIIASPHTDEQQASKPIEFSVGRLATQSVESDIQSDGTIHCRSQMAVQNLTQSPWHVFECFNSSFVDVKKFVDVNERPIDFQVELNGDCFNYKLNLNTPVKPGEMLTVVQHAVTSGLIQSVSEHNDFEYHLTHCPSVDDGDVRRLEIYRLPPGAQLVEKYPDDLQLQEKDGCLELRIDRIIPPSGSLEVRFRYRLLETDEALQDKTIATVPDACSPSDKTKGTINIESNLQLEGLFNLAKRNQDGQISPNPASKSKRFSQASHTSADADENTPRFSGIAITGAFFALVPFVVYLLLFIYLLLSNWIVQEPQATEPQQSLLSPPQTQGAFFMIYVYVVPILSSVVASFFGIISLIQIFCSSGKKVGFGMAMFDTFGYPMLGGIHLIFLFCAMNQFNNQNQIDSSLVIYVSGFMCFFLSAAVISIVYWLINRISNRSINKPLGSKEPLSHEQNTRLLIMNLSQRSYPISLK